MKAIPFIRTRQKNPAAYDEFFFFLLIKITIIED